MEVALEQIEKLQENTVIEEGLVIERKSERDVKVIKPQKKKRKGT